jgi:antitoxin component YwqK of YwqJK toxin-antitoxin module
MAKVVRTYYDLEQNKLKEEYYEVDGKKEGVYKSYRENGQLLHICNYFDDKLNGEFKSYWEDGELFEIINYVNDKIEGEYKAYWGNGELCYKNYYINGVKQT